jgi:hypothetical protein
LPNPIVSDGSQVIVTLVCYAENTLVDLLEKASVAKPNSMQVALQVFL